MKLAQLYKRKRINPADLDSKMTKSIQHQAGQLIKRLSELPIKAKFVFETNPIKIGEQCYVQCLLFEAIMWLSAIAFEDWPHRGPQAFEELADEIKSQTVLPITAYFHDKDVEAQWRTLCDTICTAAGKSLVYGYQFHSSAS